MGRAAVVGAAAVVLVALAIIVAFALRGNTGTAPTTSQSPIPQVTSVPATQARSIDGIPCNAEAVAYHVHAHLQVYDGGSPLAVPAYVGMTDTCVYWLHTHDGSGIIHVEAPHCFDARLGQFFDVWGQPLSRKQLANVRVKRGQTMRIWVNKKPFRGNPRGIPLRDRTLITIDIGPPYPAPRGYDFSSVE